MEVVPQQPKAETGASNIVYSPEILPSAEAETEIAETSLPHLSNNIIEHAHLFDFIVIRKHPA